MRRPDFATSLALIGITVGISARLWGLDGARFTGPDEYRALFFSKFQTPLFESLYRIPMSILPATQTEAIAVTAWLSILLLVLVYFYAHRLFGTEVALFSSFALALSGPFLVYSRSAYPMALQCILLIAGAGAGLRFLRLASSTDCTEHESCCQLKYGRRWRYIRLAAFLWALSVLVYVPSYAFVAGLACTLLWSTYRVRRSKRELFQTAGALFSYFVLSYLLVLALLIYLQLGRLDFVEFFSYLTRFKQITEVFSQSWSGALSDPVHAMLRFGGVPELLVFLSTGLFVIQRLTRTLTPELAFAALAPMIGTVLFIAAALCGAHTLYARHLIAALVLFAPAVGSLLASYRTQLPNSVFCGVLGVVLLNAGYLQSQIVRATFSDQPILMFLSEHGIAQTQIISSLDLRRGREPVLTQELPGRINHYPHGIFKIDWNAIRALKDRGQARYLLTSGIGSLSTVGEADPVLAAAQPLATWPHPYHFFGNPLSGLASPRAAQDFRLYDLQQSSLP